jgi:Protein of unknown function (DUF2927)
MTNPGLFPSKSYDGSPHICGRLQLRTLKIVRSPQGRCRAAFGTSFAALRDGEHRKAVMAWHSLLNAFGAWRSASVPRPLPALPACKLRSLRKRPAAILTATAIALAGTTVPAAHAEDANISSRRSSERTIFSNDEIAGGFFKIAFGAELQLGKRVERIRKFDEPVRVFVFDQGKHKRKAEIAAIIADIRAHVHHLDLAMTDDLQAANFVVMLVRKQDLKRTIRSVYGRDRAREIERSLTPQCLSGFGKDERYRIRHAEVILPADVDDFAFYDCAYEEMLQALGPINDDRSVPWTMFNDDVQMGFFDVYDQYLLNILYDPRIRPGMTKEEAGRLLPEILATVRERVAVRARAGGGSDDNLEARYKPPAPNRDNPTIPE